MPRQMQSQAIRLSRATMTGLLDTLERAGLLTRAPDPHDRRASNVKITSKGEKLLHKVQPLQSRWAQDLLAPLRLHLAHQFNYCVCVRLPIEQVNRALNNGEVRNLHAVVALVRLQAAANGGW